MPTKKEMQEQENAEVLFMLGCLKNSINNYGTKQIARLRTCNATVYETMGFTYLVSYNTIVAMRDDFTNYGYDFLRYVYGYTATSSQHIRKFFQDYNVHSVWTWRDV